MLQIENENCSFGDVLSEPIEKRYIRALILLVRKHLGNSIILCTTNGVSLFFMERGEWQRDEILHFFLTLSPIRLDSLVVGSLTSEKNYKSMTLLQ